MKPNRSVTKIISGFLGAWLLIYGMTITPATSKFLSPLSMTNTVSTFQTKNMQQLFSFAPGWSLRNLSQVDTSHLSTLAYFDMRVGADGTIDQSTAGYDNFSSDVAADVFRRVHTNGGRVLITYTQGNSDTMQRFLDSAKAQRSFIQGATDQITQGGVDGALLDFEYPGVVPASYKDKFTAFVQNFQSNLRQTRSRLTLAVAIDNNLLQTQLFDMDILPNITDNVFALASHVAVPETQANNLISRIFGYADNQYWQDIVGAMGQIISYIPSTKVEMEKAWYGNGEEYPLYQAKIGTKITKQSSYQLSPQEIDRLVGGVPDDAKTAARKNLPYIAQALDEEGILTPNVLAYALATIEHETAGTFEPIGEYGGTFSARRLGYEGGTNYYGRGFIQLTHLRNYKYMGERIGMGDALVRNPDLALQPQISAKILAAFFKENGVADLAKNGDFIDARAPINPDYNAYTIASLAYKYLGG